MEPADRLGGDLVRDADAQASSVALSAAFCSSAVVIRRYSNGHGLFLEVDPSGAAEEGATRQRSKASHSRLSTAARMRE